MLTFREYCEINDEELYILAAETGADREYDYDAEVFALDHYREYIKAQELVQDPNDPFYADMLLEDIGTGTIYGADEDIPF